MTTERGTVDPPTTFDELVARINDRFAGLSPSHQMLAELVMGDPERLAFMTGDELAAETRVSESTVDRFATEMGLDGFTTVVGLCRAKLQEGGQLLRRLTHLERLDTSLSEDHPLTLALVSEQANITRTLGRVDPATWDRAVETFSRVPRVFMFGIGKCSMVAAHFSLLLRLVRDEVYALQPSPSPLIDDLRRIQPGDCFVGIGIHRYGADTVRAFRWAQRAGATTVALTDNPSSPLVRDADMVFYVETAGVSLLRSITGFIALTQALATATAAHLGPEARPILQRKEELLTRFGVYEDVDLDDI